MTAGLHLAQLNIGRTLFPIDHPRMRGFVDRLDEINALAEASPGFVWRLKDEGGNATRIPVTEDPRVIVNLTVWESPEQLAAFTYHTRHMEVVRLRRGWFEPWPGPHLVLWWIPAGSIPTIAEALDRLDRLAATGPGLDAFTLKQRFPPPE
jgi:heme-degrading monooxygenase HmoA